MRGGWKGLAVGFVAVPFVGIAAAACGGASRAEPEPTRPGTSSEPELAELEELYRVRTDSARARFTEADVRFMTGMIAHHAQALVMAALVPKRTRNRSLRTLAARIANAQRDEIATMRRWLEERGRPVPEVRIAGTELEIRGVGHDASHMPGMLADEQLRELEEATGREFERLFLRYMIHHHRGAVTMVRELFASDGAAQDEAAFRLASDIQVDQLSEIDRMERLLASLPAEGGEGR